MHDNLDGAPENYDQRANLRKAVDPSVKGNAVPNGGGGAHTPNSKVVARSTIAHGKSPRGAGGGRPEKR